MLHSRFHICAGWAVTCLLLFVAVGCGDSGPKTYRVSGSVTWNGDPLPEGDILFVPTDGSIVPSPGKIQNGRFELKATPGPKKVEIRATREQGPVNPAMGAPERKPYIPAKYNSETTLTAEVKTSNDNVESFALTED